jgi:glycerate 2-kinase
VTIAATQEIKQHLDHLHQDALGIFHQAINACNIEDAFAHHLHFEGKRLVRHPSSMLPPLEQSLEGFKKIQIIAFGKAAIPMLEALLARLPAKLRVDGICSAPTLAEKRHRHIRYYQGSHPLPNEDSLLAAEAAMDLVKRAGRDTFIFFLISGGGSALFELPSDRSIPLEDLRALYETLVLSGADIGQVNTVRKYVSAVKGGRLAQLAPDAEKLTLLLADVPLKDIGIVASSPTLPDTSTWADCAAILDQYQLLPRLPVSLRSHFAALAKKPPAQSLATLPRTQFDVLLSNHDFVNAARDHARSLGYRVVIDNTCDNWNYDEASNYLLGRLLELRATHDRVCLLSSGEVLVKAESATAGCGGRNQHFALHSAMQMDAMDPREQNLAVLSAGSDGIDGNSPAAGAIADPTTAARARQFHFNPAVSLARFNSCPLFTALGDSIITGPTGNNLRDLRVLLSTR